MDFMPLVFIFGVVTDRSLTMEERQCIARIYKDYNRYIYKTVSQKIQKGEDAGDVVQDCYLQLTTYVDRLVHLDTPQLTRYIARVIDSCCNNYWMKNRPMLELKEEVLEIPAEEEMPLVDEEQYEIFTQAFRQLSDQDRMVLHLRYEDNLSLEQIGQVLGLKTTSVNTKLYRARKNVRGKVQKLLEQKHQGKE